MKVRMYCVVAMTTYEEKINGKFGSTSLFLRNTYVLYCIAHQKSKNFKSLFAFSPKSDDPFIRSKLQSREKCPPLSKLAAGEKETFLLCLSVCRKLFFVSPA